MATKTLLSVRPDDGFPNTSIAGSVAMGGSIIMPKMHDKLWLGIPTFSATIQFDVKAAINASTRTVVEDLVGDTLPYASYSGNQARVYIVPPGSEVVVSGTYTGVLDVLTYR